MRILCYDCFSGISGDMNLGAMIDLGVEKSFLENELAKLKLKGWKLIIGKDQRHGIQGTKVSVKVTGAQHKHRHLQEIEKIIRNSGLETKTKDLAMNIFMKIATAEAHVHGIDVNKVHFHEVGAVDSIIDVAGAAICFRALKVDEVYVPTVELGGGFAICGHGTLPVPAPATVEILKNIPVKTGGTGFEATTPTGAAIIAVLGTKFGPSAGFRILKTGYGVGQKDDPEVPNLLRVFLGETNKKHTGHDALLIECNIDDMNPEFFDYIAEKLFDAGASDVFLSNIIMKKGRPGIVLNVISESGIEDAVKEIIFRESTSVGIRSFPFRKDTLSRKYEVLKTKFGEVTIKRSYLGRKEVTSKPEYEDCRRIALQKGIPVKEVYNYIMALIVKK